VDGFEHLKFSFRGFSSKRMALLLIGVQLWLLCLVNMEIYYDAGHGIGVVSAIISLAVLVLGIFCPGSCKSRFLPFVLALVIVAITLLFTPL
jgi:hypothetical protein